MNLREGRWAILIGLVLHALFLSSLSAQFLNPLFAEAEQAHGQAGDYFGIYQAGDNFIQGKSIYDWERYRNESEPRVPYFYFYRYLPPTAMIASIGTLLLSPWAAYWNWVIVNELILGLLILWILRLDRFPMQQRRYHAALWLGFFPFYLEQWMGQFSFLMTAFLWIMLRDTMPDRVPHGREPAPAGRALRAWIASIGLKSFTALFAISYLARRQIRPVMIAAGAVIIACAPYYVARPEDLKQFLFVNFRPLPPGVHGGTLGASALIRLLGWTIPESIAAIRIDLRLFDIYLGNVPVFAFDFLVIVGLIWIVVRRAGRIPIQLQVSLWLLAFFMIFTDIWEYHYVMVLPILTAVGLTSGSTFVLWIGLLFALPTPYALFAQNGSLSLVGELLQHASKAVPTMLLFVWILRRCRAFSRQEM
jgi:hypothetical protein